jgi:predicted HAD superfamily Cof-like phosphohydrolase
MKDQLKKLVEFHSTFGHTIETSPCSQSDTMGYLRYNLGKEELDEYIHANEMDDPIEIADALTDQLYILLGTIVAHGMQDIIEECFDEVHRSNMSKLGLDGKPVYREDGKILKGPNYIKPDLGKIVYNAWNNDASQLKIEFNEEI